MIHKQILVPDRVRRPPTDGWSWIDRRFLREHASRLSHEAIVLYFFLAAVSDKDGLSFYGDASIAAAPADGAKRTWSRHATNWWRRTWWPTGRRWRRCSPCPPPRVQRRGGGLAAFGEILRTLADPSSSSDSTEVLMKVSLWAEIRRLHEIEGLTARAIARRLHCCTKTVPKALAMPSPPTPEAEPRESILDRYRPQIDALVAKYPDLSAVRVTEEISKGEDGYRGSVYPVRRYLHQVRPARGRVYQEVLYEPGEAMQVDWGDCGRVMIGQTPAAGLGLRGGALLQPAGLHRIQPLPAQGGVLPGVGPRPGVLSGQSAEDHL